jgi:hypothetical protein
MNCVDSNSNCVDNSDDNADDDHDDDDGDDDIIYLVTHQ